MSAGLRTDVLVVGGGLGGVAAALAVARAGRQVVLVEETDWVGGQLTAQAVPPDEHPWIEHFGCTAGYRRLREGIRDHYRRWYPLTERARTDPHLNPGAGFVSRLCHEPRVALAVLDAMLGPHRSAGRLRVLAEHRAVAAEVEHDHVQAVSVRDLRSGEGCTIEAGYVIDATETGELLPMTGAEHVTGSEARRDTGEPSAQDQARPDNMQAVTHCFALEHREGEDHTIDRPPAYERWRQATLPGWPGPMFAWQTPDPKTGRTRTHTFGPNPDVAPGSVTVDMRAEGGADDLWLFRRILARGNFVDGAVPSDITLVNWPMADYIGGPVIGDGGEQHLQAAGELSLCLLHWLQTEAPRDDGGTGFPGLRTCPEVTGTPDGFAKQVYIRESRRIRAVRPVTELDIGVQASGREDPATFPDTVGVGCYRIDLHPTTGGDPYLDVAARPFEIPLGALLPVRVRNLLPAAKNIGTTHITNGCFRLHPVEWGIGEAVGSLATYCLDGGTEPHAVGQTPRLLAAFQDRLRRDGVELHWPKDEAVRAY